MRVLGGAAGPQTLQTIVGDLQDEATVHHAVRRLQATMRHDDAVMEEQHTLVTKQTTTISKRGGEKNSFNSRMYHDFFWDDFKNYFSPSIDIFLCLCAGDSQGPRRNVCGLSVRTSAFLVNERISRTL